MIVIQFAVYEDAEQEIPLRSHMIYLPSIFAAEPPPSGRLIFARSPFISSSDG
jgi:hypothetical protein